MVSMFQSLLTRVAICTAMAVAIPLSGSPVFAQEQLAPSRPAAGADSADPVVLVRVGSVGKLQRDVNYLTGVAGFPQYGGMFAGLSGVYTQGVDPSRPLGIALHLVGQTPEPLLLIPANDVKQTLKVLEQTLGPAEEQGDGVYALSVASNVIFVKQNPGWAVVARNQDLLKLAPQDPGAMLQSMGGDYDLAFRLRMQLVPADLRAALVDQLRQGFEQAMAQQGGDADQTRAYAESTIEQLSMLIEETEELFFGWNTDPNAKELVFDTRFTAVPDSRFAAIYSGQQPIPSRFASVIRDDAAAYLHGAGSIAPEAIEQTRSSITSSVAMVKNAIRQQGDIPDDQMDEVESMIDRIAELVVDSVAEGKSDAGAVLLTDDSGVQFVFGTFVSDGNEAASIVQDLAAKLKDVQDAPEFKFNIRDYNGVTMHLVQADVPASEDEARRVLGEQLKVYLGTAPNAVYLALGDASVPLLRELIDSGSQDAVGDRPISQLKVDLKPILQYIRSIESNPVIDSMIGALDQPNELPGRMTAVANSIPDGQQSTLRVGEGILRAVGAGIAAGQRQGGGQPNPGF